MQLDTSQRQHRTPPSIARLCLVEFRKLVDTRPGAVMIMIGALLTGVCGGGAVIFWDQPSLDRIIRFAGTPAMLLIPVLSTLLITAEHSQHTAVVSFTLVPRRGRLLMAKLITVVLAATAVVALCILAGLIIAIAGPPLRGHPVSWRLDGAGLGWFAVAMIIAALTGYAVGLLTQNAPATIVIVLTWQLIAVPLQAIPTVGTIFAWLDFTAISSFVDGVAPVEIGRMLTGLTVWVVVPAAIGWWRQSTGEVR